MTSNPTQTASRDVQQQEPDEAGSPGGSSHTETPPGSSTEQEGKHQELRSEPQAGDTLESVPSDGRINPPEAHIENEEGSDSTPDSVREKVFQEQVDSFSSVSPEEDSQRDIADEPGNDQQNPDVWSEVRGKRDEPGVAGTTEPPGSSSLESDISDTLEDTKSSTRESESVSDDVGVKGEAEEYHTKQGELLEQRMLLIQQQRAEHQRRQQQLQQRQQQQQLENKDHDIDRQVQSPRDESGEGQATDNVPAGEGNDQQHNYGESLDVDRDAVESTDETHEDRGEHSPKVDEITEGIPYSWKLSRVKTFANFVVLPPSAKVLSTKF